MRNGFEAMSGNDALVTVVMPSFNQRRFLEPAVRSVLEQDYPAVELLVVDGGSTDGSLNSLERLGAIFGDRLRWLSQRDSGPANAINRALRLVRSEIIGWLNSDDLYAPQAVASAARHLVAHPELLMVYGHAEHIDETGASLGAYPTRPPPVAPERFQAGCFICQPSVFLRRQALESVGLLDESLATAFDFDLWMRLFKKFPERIGFIDRLLARSRLHADCITSRQRRLVATENLRILSKHFDHAEPHWLLTYVEEVYAGYPHAGPPADLHADVQAALAEVEPFLSERDLAWTKDVIARDARYQLAAPGLYAAVHGDGWAPSPLAIRVCGSGKTKFVLHGENRRPDGHPLRLEIRSSWGDSSSMRVDKAGRFRIPVAIPEAVSAGNFVLTVTTPDTWTAATFDTASSDHRPLAFRLLRIE